MAIEFLCSGCQKRLRVPEGTEGQMAQCPLCGAQTPIPPASEGEELASAPPVAGRSGDFGSSMPPETAWSPASGTPGMPVGEPQRRPFPEKPSLKPGRPIAGQTAPWPGDWPTQYAYARIRTPANWLVVLSAMGFGFGLVSVILVVVGMMAGHHPHGVPPPEPLPPDRSAFFLLMGIGLLFDLLVLAGSMKMKQLQSYPLAMTAALLAVLPCTSPCCLLSMPFGLWALVVLTDPAVKSAFK